MNAKHYNNVIDWTLKYNRAAQTEDPLATARAVFNNMGVALPNGSMQEVYETIKTNEYMGWRTCTMQEAQEAANKGTAAIGISKNRIIILAADVKEYPISETTTVRIVSETNSNDVGLQYKATQIDEIENTRSLDYYAYSSSTPNYLVNQLSGIQTFSYREDGDKSLSKNFKVREFRCLDGSDEIKIDMTLVLYLQTIRDLVESPISITSGYRTPSHNANVGGAAGSQHLYGKAADIICSGRSPLQIARIAETLGMLGIEWNLDGNYTHIDTRTVKWFARYANGTFYQDFSSFYNLTEPG